MKTNRIRWITCLSPALLLAFSGSALAGGKDCHAEVAAAHHEHVHAAHAAHAADAALVRVRGEDSESEHSWSDGKNDIKIVRKDGKVCVTFNGEEIMNLDDAELFHADIAQAHEQAQHAQEWARTMRDRVRRGMAPMPPMPPGQPQAFGFGGEQPKVMIGVTMETAGEAQAKVPAGVDAEAATVITRVVEGLPADKAGLKQGDIVVQVNGVASAAPDDIREAIKDKKAGDELKLRVIREGNEKDIVIALAEYDGGKLGAPRAWGFSGSTDSDSDAPEELSEADVKKLEELRSQMDKTSAELEQIGAQLAAAKSPEERERLAAAMGELGEKMAALGGDMGDLTGSGAQWRFLYPGQNNFDIQRLPRMRIERGQGGNAPKAFVFTPDGGLMQSGEPDRIQKLDERLERLEKLLEKIVEEKNKN